MRTDTIATPKTDKEQSATDLLQAAGTGINSAWEEILRRYGRLVLKTVLAFRLSHADTLDAVQITWLRLVENHHQIESPERLSGWLVTTARRECLRILRNTRRMTNADTTEENTVDAAAGPEQQAIDTATARILRKLVAELPPRQQILLHALFTDNHHYTEAARITGISHGSIGPTRRRALTKLRQRLEQHGIS